MRPDDIVPTPVWVGRLLGIHLQHQRHPLAGGCGFLSRNSTKRAWDDADLAAQAEWVAEAREEEEEVEGNGKDMDTALIQAETPMTWEQDAEEKIKIGEEMVKKKNAKQAQLYQI